MTDISYIVLLERISKYFNVTRTKSRYLNDKKISWDMLIQQHLLLMHNCGKCNYLINPASPQNKAFIRKRLHIVKLANMLITLMVSCILLLQLGLHETKSNNALS